jgi:hypothetical protein
VLIPVFALGRAQELCLLLEQYWERMQLKARCTAPASIPLRRHAHYHAPPTRARPHADAAHADAAHGLMPTRHGLRDAIASSN